MSYPHPSPSREAAGSSGSSTTLLKPVLLAQTRRPNLSSQYHYQRQYQTQYERASVDVASLPAGSVRALSRPANPNSNVNVNVKGKGKGRDESFAPVASEDPSALRTIRGPHPHELAEEVSPSIKEDPSSKPASQIPGSSASTILPSGIVLVNPGPVRRPIRAHYPSNMRSSFLPSFFTSKRSSETSKTKQMAKDGLPPAPTPSDFTFSSIMQAISNESESHSSDSPTSHDSNVIPVRDANADIDGIARLLARHKLSLASAHTAHIDPVGLDSSPKPATSDAAAHHTRQPALSPVQELSLEETLSLRSFSSSIRSTRHSLQLLGSSAHAMSEPTIAEDPRDVVRTEVALSPPAVVLEMRREGVTVNGGRRR